MKKSRCDVGLCSFKKMQEDFWNGVYNFTENGKCIQCGECFSNFLPISKREIEEIKKYIKKHEVKEQKHFLPLVNSQIDATCPFLNTGKKTERCNIYRVRPAICRWFKCDKPTGMTEHIDEALKEIRFPVDMRKIFYGQ